MWRSTQHEPKVGQSPTTRLRSPPFHEWSELPVRRIFGQRGNARVLSVVSVALLLVGTSACGGSSSTESSSSGSSAAADKQLTLNMGVQSLVIQTYYPQLAEALGYFKDENLKVNVTVGESTANSVQGLIGGSIDLYNGGPEGLSANEQGADLRFIAAGSNTSIWNLVAAKGITDIKQLQGAAIGVSALQSISTVTTRQALAANGVDPKSLKFIVAGGSSKRFAALQAGQVKAVPLGIPVNYQASESEGFKDFGNTNDLGAPPLSGAVITVSKKWADGHKEELRRFLRAYQRTIDALYDPAMKDKIADIVATGIKVDKPYVERAIDEIFLSGKSKSMPKDAKVDPAALQTAADAFVEFGALKKKIDASTTIDNSYLEDAQNSLKTDPPKGS
jgi:NitT/TauT family transport system substrate-binding protein